MATAVVVQIADAVLNAIESGSWSQDFRPERSYADWDEQLTEAERLRVDVVPKFDPTIELDTRGTLGWLVAIDVCVRKRLGQTEQDQATGKLKTSAIDDMVYLVESLGKFLIADRFTDLDATCGAVWQSTTIPALFIRDHLRQWSQFTGFVRVTFSGHGVNA